MHLIQWGAFLCLGALGLCKEHTIPYKDDLSGEDLYFPAYRSLTGGDECKDADLSLIAARLGSAYPDEVLI